MTREEAIKILRKEIECLSHTKCEDCILEAACDPIKTTPYDSEYIEVYEMAIKALEQEPCDDAISRQAVLDLLFNSYIKTELTSIGYANKEYAELCVDELNELPSVNPQEPKTSRLYNDIYDHYLCGNCKTIVMDYDNFCPNCGARMESEESNADSN